MLLPYSVLSLHRARFDSCYKCRHSVPNMRRDDSGAWSQYCNLKFTLIAYSASASGCFDSIMKLVTCGIIVGQKVSTSIQASRWLRLNKVDSNLNISASMLPLSENLVAQVWMTFTVSHPFPSNHSISKASDFVK